MMKTLKAICKEKDLYITKPDKGNCVVLMDKDQYIKKMEKLLESPKFSQIPTNKKNVFISKETQVNNKLLQLKNNRQLTDSQYKLLRSTGCQPSRLYGLPKLHKNVNDPPMRPILSMTDSFCENICD